MPSRVRLTDADIRQHAARKRLTSGARPSRPPKRPQTSSSADMATVAAQPDTERSSGFELVIALSAPAVPPEAPSEEGMVEGQSKECRLPHLWKRFGLKHVSPNDLWRLPSHPREELSRARASHPFSIFGPGRQIGGRLRWHRWTTRGRRAASHRPMFGSPRKHRPWPTMTWPGGCARQPFSRLTGSS